MHKYSVKLLSSKIRNIEQFIFISYEKDGYKYPKNLDQLWNRP